MEFNTISKLVFLFSKVDLSMELPMSSIIELITTKTIDGKKLPNTKWSYNVRSLIQIAASVDEVLLFLKLQMSKEGHFWFQIYLFSEIVMDNKQSYGQFRSWRQA